MSPHYSLKRPRPTRRPFTQQRPRTMKLTRSLALASILLSLSAIAAPTPQMPTLKPYKGPALDMTGAIESPGFEADTFTIACWVPSQFDLDKWAKRGITVAWFNQRLNPKE